MGVLKCWILEGSIASRVEIHSLQPWSKPRDRVGGGYVHLQDIPERSPPSPLTLFKKIFRFVNFAGEVWRASSVRMVCNHDGTVGVLEMFLEHWAVSVIGTSRQSPEALPKVHKQDRM